MSKQSSNRRLLDTERVGLFGKSPRSPTKVKQGHILGFLPRNDASNIIILSALYLLQGIPFGLAFGSLPYLLRQRLSFSDMAVFSFAGYPYSLKLLWSPIVDSVFSTRMGRRKSWIIPIQLLTGLLFFVLSGIMTRVLESKSLDINSFTVMWLAVIALCATQDIAVDGWALTLLSKENVEFGSTCQTVGINTGYFASFTVFLALNSPDFCNKYLRSAPEDLGLVSLGGYLRFWGYFYIILTFLLLIFKKEKKHLERDRIPIRTAYMQIAEVLKLPHVLKLVAVLLLAKIAFIANETVSPFKLLEKGIQKEDLALSVLIDFPFQILFGYLAAQWSSGPRPLRPWLAAYCGRLLFATIGLLVVYYCPTGKEITMPFFMVVIGSTVLTSFMSTVQFVGVGAFFSRIADPIIGGTYMTLLNTVSNLGGTWPRYFVLEAVDYFTNATCSVGNTNCATDELKKECNAAKGTCLVHRDGYYTIGIASVVAGVLLLVFFIQPRVRFLESLHQSRWKIAKRP